VIRRGEKNNYTAVSFGKIKRNRFFARGKKAMTDLFYAPDIMIL
jgi:hypothetical protein